MNQPRTVPRRFFLRGGALGIAIPALTSLLPRGVAAAAPPRRLLVTFFPNGAPTQWWEHAPPFNETLSGSAFRLSQVLEPFAPLKSKMLQISRLGNWSHRGDNGRGQGSDSNVWPGHGRLPSAFLTGVDAFSASVKAGDMAEGDFASWRRAAHGGTSVDQVVVQKLQLDKQTPIASLQVGLGTRPGGFDRFSAAFNQAVSWAAPDRPLLRQINPLAVYETLVRAGARGNNGAGVDRALAQIAAENRSVLDRVLDHARTIQLRLSSDDRRSLDQFLTAFRETEARLVAIPDAIPNAMPGGCAVGTKPGAIPEPPGENRGLSQGDALPGGGRYDRATHARLMKDLIMIALRCDLTRVVTYMMDDSRSEFVYKDAVPAADRLTAAGNWDFHGSQHASPSNTITYEVQGGRYRNTQTSNLPFASIVRWMNRLTADLALALDQVPEGPTGTMLDNTLILHGSEMRGHDHEGADLPVILLGGGSTFKKDTHVSFGVVGSDREHQMRDLHYTILKHHFGIAIDRFGDDFRGLPNQTLSALLA